uniref:Microfibril associated protein 4 n=1 Tax=Ornithorhynchus anatinus TaxID=9258 RepID=A0A6I8N1L9_ORNAN
MARLSRRAALVEKQCLQQPLDCDDIYSQGLQADGVYLIYPLGPSVPVPVFCDMTTDEGKWTVFQKRFNGSVSFFRGWNDYKLGFGRADGEYWLGLQNLHLLTLKQDYELRVDLEDFENNTAFAKYKDFSISPNAISAEEDGYTLHVAGFEDGGAGSPPHLTPPPPKPRGTGPVESVTGAEGFTLPAPSPPPPSPAVPLSPSTTSGRGTAGAEPGPGLNLGTGEEPQAAGPRTAPPPLPAAARCLLSLPRAHPADIWRGGEVGAPRSPPGPRPPPRHRPSPRQPRPPLPSLQATPSAITAARSSPPSTGTKTSSCRTARPSPPGPSGSGVATSPTSTASTWAALTSPTPTASTGPSGRASTIPSNVPR